MMDARGLGSFYISNYWFGGGGKPQEVDEAKPEPPSESARSSPALLDSYVELAGPWDTDLDYGLVSDDCSESVSSSRAEDEEYEDILGSYVQVLPVL
jgi:hypothetical protein